MGELEEDDDYRVVLAKCEKAAESKLATQVLDKDDRFYGGFRDPGTLICDPAVACHTFTLLATLYFTPDSKFYGSRKLWGRLQLVMRFIASRQHKDGTVDYTITNFHSAPDTAFIVTPFCELYRYLKRFSDSRPSKWRDAGKVMKFLEEFIRRGADAVARGPMHTPNHRWVAVAALAEADNLFPNREWREAAEDYLSDGIDINGDGVYTERSRIYDMVSNKALLIAARFLGRPRLREYVERNLDFTVYNLRRDGTLVTEYSRRQDRNTDFFVNGYEVWKEMAYWTDKGVYLYMASLALRHHGTSLLFFHNYPELAVPGVKPEPPPKNYLKVFRETRIARVRTGDVDCTVMADNFNNVFSYRYGGVILDALKISFPYFARPRFFEPKTLLVRGRRLTLVERFKGRIYRPAPHREVWQPANLTTRVEFGFKNGEVEVAVSQEGDSYVATTVELCFRRRGVLEVEGRSIDLSTAERRIFLKDGYAVVRAGGYGLEVGPGRMEHRLVMLEDPYNPVLRENCVSVLMTFLTPFRHRFRLRPLENPASPAKALSMLYE